MILFENSYTADNLINLDPYLMLLIIIKVIQKMLYIFFLSFLSLFDSFVCVNDTMNSNKL